MATERHVMLLHPKNSDDGHQEVSESDDRGPCGAAVASASSTRQTEKSSAQNGVASVDVPSIEVPYVRM